MPILERLMRPHPDDAVVLATSWVRLRSFDFAKKRLSPDIQRRVIGATFHRLDMRKGKFLLLHCRKHIASGVFGRGPKNWFAIDDDHFG
jgi:hypothetical protein